MKLKRLAPGDYLSECGRVRIRRQFRVVAGCVPDTVWHADVDSNLIATQTTKRDAVRAALAELRRRDGG